MSAKRLMTMPTQELTTMPESQLRELVLAGAAECRWPRWPGADPHDGGERPWRDACASADRAALMARVATLRTWLRELPLLLTRGAAPSDDVLVERVPGDDQIAHAPADPATARMQALYDAPAAEATPHMVEMVKEIATLAATAGKRLPPFRVDLRDGAPDGPGGFVQTAKAGGYQLVLNVGAAEPDFRGVLAQLVSTACDLAAGLGTILAPVMLAARAVAFRSQILLGSLEVREAGASAKLGDRSAELFLNRMFAAANAPAAVRPPARPPVRAVPYEPARRPEPWQGRFQG